MLPEYWTEEDVLEADNAETFGELSEIALRIAERQRAEMGPLLMVCGPITSGPRGLEENIKIFAAAIAQLQGKGEAVFNQLPFEPALWRIIRNKKKEPGYLGGTELLDEFYKPIFESGLVSGLRFIPGWEESFGARWERAQGERIGLEISYFEIIFL